jgi:hypothetical protein
MIHVVLFCVITPFGKIWWFRNSQPFILKLLILILKRGKRQPASYENPFLIDKLPALNQNKSTFEHGGNVMQNADTLHGEKFIQNMLSAWGRALRIRPGTLWRYSAD